MPLTMASASVNTTVLPLTATFVTEFTTPLPIVTKNKLADRVSASSMLSSKRIVRVRAERLTSKSVAAGGVASTVTASAVDAAPTSPDASVALAVIERAPAASVTSRLNAPVAFAVVVPSEVAPSNNSTRALASAWPVMVSAEVWLVTLSALSVPLSSIAAKSRSVGAAGGVTSTVTANTDDAAPTLPAASVALAVIERAPAASVTSRLNAPVAFAVVVPSEVAPSNNSTRVLASAWPVMVSAEVWLVT